MLMLAGLMGLLMVGASAFIGFEDTSETRDERGDPDDFEPDSSLMDGDIIVGTTTGEVLSGGDGGDQIGGYSGDDTMDGGDGTDILRGGDGADILDGSGGADTIHAGDADDIVYGSSGDDRLFGEMGRDLLSGGIGVDSMHGGAGQDTLSGGSGDDALLGGLDDDALIGGQGTDTLFGGSGDDWIAGFSAKLAGVEAVTDPQSDYLNGGPGNDTLVGDAGDILTLGAGADHAVIGDWIGQGDTAATVLDFLAEEDQLVLLYSDDAGADPEIEVEMAGDATRVLMDGALVALLPAGTNIGASDIALLPESAAGQFLYPPSSGGVTVP